MKILHIATPHKFTIPFFELIEKEFAHEQHCILSHASTDDWPNGTKIKNRNSAGPVWLWDFTRAIYSSEKVIIHGLWDVYVIALLFLQPWLLKKCYWMIFGGDLYDYESSRKNWRWWLRILLKKPVIKRMGHLVTYVEGDVELARNWFGARGKYHECIMYVSNIYREYPIKSESHSAINIQIGNSADPSNNHLEILDKLYPFRDENITIYAPLSYGCQEYANSVIKIGKELFGDKFVPLTEFMPFDQYLNFLGRVDIAIFNHKRQQAMGNIITLLGLGKKVYMRNDVSSWRTFSKAGIKIYEVSSIELSRVNKSLASSNQRAIKSLFSEEKIISQLNEIFGS